MAHTMQVRRERATDVSFDVRKNANGEVEVVANGEVVVTFTKDGYLKRNRSVSQNVALRRLPDGRVAIRKKRNGARA